VRCMGQLSAVSSQVNQRLGTADSGREIYLTADR
jgi:hypothetical protein